MASGLGARCRRSACYRELWGLPDRILAVAEAAERTLCHLGVWPASLADDAGRRSCPIPRSRYRYRYRYRP